MHSNCFQLFSLPVRDILIRPVAIHLPTITCKWIEREVKNDQDPITPLGLIKLDEKNFIKAETLLQQSIHAGANIIFVFIDRKKENAEYSQTKGLEQLLAAIATMNDQCCDLKLMIDKAMLEINLDHPTKESSQQGWNALKKIWEFQHPLSEYDVIFISTTEGARQHLKKEWPHYLEEYDTLDNELGTDLTANLGYQSEDDLTIEPSSCQCDVVARVTASLLKKFIAKLDWVPNPAFQDKEAQTHMNINWVNRYIEKINHGLM